MWVSSISNYKLLLSPTGTKLKAWSFLPCTAPSVECRGPTYYTSEHKYYLELFSPATVRMFRTIVSSKVGAASAIGGMRTHSKDVYEPVQTETDFRFGSFFDSEAIQRACWLLVVVGTVT